MPSPHQRGLKKKFRKTAKSTKVFFVRDRHGKHHCGLCEAELNGVPHKAGQAAVAKLPKTGRRPSAMFGGVLCEDCRMKVWEETVKVHAKVKEMDRLDLRVKPFVTAALPKLEGPA